MYNNKKNSILFTPFQLGEVQLKNRFVVSALATDFCNEGTVNSRFIEYHRTKAKGGWGLIITENYAVAPAGRGLWVPGLWSDKFIPGNVELVEAVHKNGSKIFVQLYHCGRQGTSSISGMELEAPSAIPCPVMKEMPRELTIEEIEKLTEDFGDAALRAKKAGFDGVELNLAHGYLLASFLSAYANKRVDKYGGSIDNRVRFPMDIYKNIRKKCGDDYPVICKISAEEFVEGGRTIEETIVIARMLEQAGVDAISISAGVYESGETIIPPMYVECGWLAKYAEEVKKSVDIPVIVVGRINDPRIADTIVKTGKADLVAMGRASLADPDLPNKYRVGDCSDIRKCIACQQGCRASINRGEPIRCLVNPKMGIEYQVADRMPAKAQKVAVVGGGIAGMQAAITAAEEGHKVTLYEKTDKLGGSFGIAAVPPAKGTMATLVIWQQDQISKLPIEVKLNTEFTVAIYEETKPDVVVSCTGSNPLKPNIPGIDLPNVVTAAEVLSGKIKTGDTVIFAGGGLIGAEAADELSREGKKVTVIEMRSQIAPDEEESRRLFLMKALEKQNVEMLVNTKIVEITDHSVIAERDGKKIEREADNVILSLGIVANKEMANALAGKVKVISAGDEVKGRNALEAMREGYLAAISIGR